MSCITPNNDHSYDNFPSGQQHNNLHYCSLILQLSSPIYDGTNYFQDYLWFGVWLSLQLKCMQRPEFWFENSLQQTNNSNFICQTKQNLRERKSVSPQRSSSCSTAGRPACRSPWHTSLRRGCSHSQSSRSVSDASSGPQPECTHYWRSAVDRHHVD